MTAPGRWYPIKAGPRLYAVLGAVAIAFSSILVRLSHASPSTAAIFRCAYAVPVLGLLARREDRRYGPRNRRDRLFALAAGLFFTVDLILWHRSIADVGAGLATVLANIQVVLVPLVAWALLSEHPGNRVLLALGIALAGVLLISGVLEHGAYGRDPQRGALYGLGAGVAYVGFLLLLRRGGADIRRPAGPLFDATATAAVACTLAGLAIGDADLAPDWPDAGWLVTLALTSQVLGWLLITSSLPRLPAALTSLLLCVQPIGSVLLGALIFSESPSVLQLAGVVLVLVALLSARSSGATITPTAELDFVRGSELLSKAYDLAASIHRGQRDEADGAPYIDHPVAVARLLHDGGFGEEVVVAGLLHDTVERSGVTCERLRDEFGDRVAELVEAVSEPEDVEPFRARKAALREQVAEGGRDIAAIFAADKLAKVASLRRAIDEHGHDEVARRISNPLVDKLDHYHASLALLRARLPEVPMVEELARELHAVECRRARTR